MPLDDSDPYWAARFRMSPQQADELRRRAEETVREGYHATTRAMGRLGGAAGRVAAPAAEAVDKFKVGVREEMDRLSGDQEGRGVAIQELQRRQAHLDEVSPAYQIGVAAGRFHRGRDDSRAADTIGGDKYFHCKANCEATRLGPSGELAAFALSELREGLDPKNYKDGGADKAEDQRANRLGRAVAHRHPRLSCSDACASRRPTGLADRW